MNSTSQSNIRDEKKQRNSKQMGRRKGKSKMTDLNSDESTMVSDISRLHTPIKS